MNIIVFEFLLQNYVVTLKKNLTLKINFFFLLKVTFEYF